MKVLGTKITGDESSWGHKKLETKVEDEIDKDCFKPENWTNNSLFI